MLSVVLIWIYVLITTYLVGYAVSQGILSLECMHTVKGKGNKRYNPIFFESYIVAGIVVNTVYAQLFSLFAGVGLSANIIMILICVVIAVYYRNEISCDLRDMMRIVSADRNWVFYLIIFLIMAYGTSHGLMHYDSDLYHAQAIHWIEDYGIVKGLGNLHVRLAYNSAAFPLSALYSMKFLTGRSFHVMAGFFALLLAWQCLDLKNIVRRGHPVLSDFARIMAIYYLFTIYDEMVAPASDYFLSTIVFYIFIHWLDMYVKHVSSYVPYIFLSLVGVYAVTIKLSAAPILLLSVIPIYKLLHSKNRESKKALILSVFLALVIAMPYLIRNVVISGWLVYPVTAIDLFNSNWKIPKGIADFDAREIKTFGRGYNDVAVYGDVPFKEWIVNWFNSITGFSKVMIILDIIAIVIYFACVIYFLIVAVRENPKLKDRLNENKVFDLSHRSVVRLADFLTISGTMILCLLFWLFSAPLIRYGVVYVCLTFAIVFGRLIILGYNRLDNTKKVVNIGFKLAVGLLVIWVGYKGVRLVMDDIPRMNGGNLLAQQDYGSYEVSSFDVDGLTIYYPTEGDRVGYYPFPATTYDMTGMISFIDDGIESGILSRNEQ